MATIGLLSDSHGHVGRTKEAVRLLLEGGADCLIPLGDVGTAGVLDALVCGQDENGQLHPEVHVVFGNTDYDTGAMGRYAGSLGIHVDHPGGRIEVDGKSIAFSHGHLQHLMDVAIEDGVTYFCHGHTHEKKSEWVDRTHVINPGALTRAKTYTAALLEPKNGDLRWVEIAR